jgi:hypothetical protein
MVGYGFRTGMGQNNMVGYDSRTETYRFRTKMGEIIWKNEVAD